MYFDGSNTSNRILDVLEEKRPKVILIDEIDKMASRQFQNQLLGFMESGIVDVEQQRKQYHLMLFSAALNNSFVRVIFLLLTEGYLLSVLIHINVYYQLEFPILTIYIILIILPSSTCTVSYQVVSEIEAEIVSYFAVTLKG